MPIYVYECPDGHVTEELHSHSTKPDTTVCGCGKNAKQIITPVGMVIASGWLGLNGKEEAALHRAREVNEWTEAIGKRVERNGSKNFTTSPTEPRSWEVSRKRDHLKSGGSLPPQFAHVADMA